MISVSEVKIMGMLSVHPYEEYSIRGISTVTGISYALTYDTVQSLIKRGLICSRKVGKAIVCRFNLSADPKILSIYSLLYSYKFLESVNFKYLIQEICDKLFDELYILILFGSYANETFTKESDIDLFFVVDDKSKIGSVRKKIRSVLSTTNLKVDFEVATIDWLYDMFSYKDSVGREILESSIILHGAEHYYTLVNRYDQKR